MKTKRLFLSAVAMVLCVIMCGMTLVACVKDDGETPGTDTKPVTTPGTDNPGGPTTMTEHRVTNDEYTFVIQNSTFDGVFNPFFYTSGYDEDVVAFVNASLVTMDPTGAIVAGSQYDTVAESYSIYYTNDLTNYTPKTTFEEGDYVVYEFVIKNGCKFSDGEAVTADDVLFNYYVQLDPKYQGSNTLYTQPILGLTDYRTQVAGSGTYGAVADAILAAGRTYVPSDAYTEAQFNAYWEAMNNAGKAFAQEIVSYVKTNYNTPDYNAAGTAAAGNGLDLSVEGNAVAFGMSMWGFGQFLSETTYAEGATGSKGYDAESGNYPTLYIPSEEATSFFDADGKYYAQVGTTEGDFTFYTLSAPEKTDAGYLATFTPYAGGRYVPTTTYSGEFQDGTGKVYDMVNTLPTVEDYWAALQAGYADEAGATDYTSLNDTESAGMDLLATAKEGFLSAYAQIGSVSSISGLVKGKTADGANETVKIILTQQNPKAILSLGVIVAPMHYYTAGYSYKTGSLVSFGCEYASEDFMAHLKTYNSAPVGAGTYKFVEYRDGDVYFERNEYHETMGDDNVYNANIKYVCMKAVEGGAEFDALKAGDIAYATVDATSNVMEELAKLDKLTSVLVDNLGYGYICINPAASKYGLDNLYTRIALTSVFNLELVYEYYPSGLADVIYRSQTQVSWAYPEGAKAIYPYDETLATAVENLKKAGYTWVEDAARPCGGYFTDVPEQDFYLPFDAANHPAGAMFLNAQELLAKIGVTVNLKVDAQLTSTIKTQAIPVYALAWSAAADPDMFQVYHYESAAESVISNGVVSLHDNGDHDELGMIEVTKLDGSVVNMNQKQALDYLAELIEDGVKYMSVEERAPIYTKALEVLAQINLELPTYQRKNMFVYDNSVIDGTTLSTTVTPYWGPIAEIWKVSFADGVSGNTTIDVEVAAH